MAEDQQEETAVEEAQEEAQETATEGTSAGDVAREIVELSDPVKFPWDNDHETAERIGAINGKAIVLAARLNNAGF